MITTDAKCHREIKISTVIGKMHFQFLNEEKNTEKKPKQESEKAHDKNNDVEYGSAWFREINHE